MALRAKPLLKSVYPYYVGNKAITDKSNLLSVIDKFTGKEASSVCVPSTKVIHDAIDQCVNAAPAMRALPTYTRKSILLDIAQKIKERSSELATAIVVEVGKPITDAKGEVGRAIDTFTIAAEESVRIPGEHLRLDISARNAGYEGITKRFPIGPVSMIAPFNFPLNLVAHKVAPAIAAGCPFVLKPSERTPISALLLGEIMSSVEGLPQGSFSILPCNHDDVPIFSKDERFKMVSFTGSPGVGWHIKNTAGRKKVTLELGGNAACIVDDLAPKQLEAAVKRLLFGAYYSQGQSCISVQRIYVHEAVYDKVKAMMTEGAKDLNAKRGDPLDENTFLGPMISEGDCERLEKWVSEAVKDGAKVVYGGKRDGRYFDVTLLENVNPKSSAYCKEVFGPIALIEKFSDFKSAVAKVNESEFGLQAGLFTQDLNKAFYAYEHIEAGGVVVGDVPSARVDSQPYGGIKSSGFGREGVKYAIEDFSEVKIMLMKNVGVL